MLSGHGGNIQQITGSSNMPENRIIDFSSNINPFGVSRKIRNLINKNAHTIAYYPDPECVSARHALSKFLGVDKNNILVGNGSNEIIHLVPRALGCSSALIYNPAFSEYELSIKLSKAKPYFLFARETDGFLPDIRKVFNYVKKVNLIILCNPNNPTGSLLKKDELLELAGYCMENKTYLFVDEVFMEFVDNEEKFSLKKEVLGNNYLLILRSLTKFFGLPGLRIGYLLADKNLLKKVRLFQPTWAVNGLAQAIAAGGLFDPAFIKKAKECVINEKNFLFDNLKQIKGIYPYYPNANFIFCKISDKRLNAKTLYLRLAKDGMLIRDCSNFGGLDNRFFRVAAKKRKDNLRLLSCLRRIFR